MVMMFSLVFATMLPMVTSDKAVEAKKNRWGGDEMDDWPLSISCNPVGSTFRRYHLFRRGLIIGAWR